MNQFNLSHHAILRDVATGINPHTTWSGGKAAEPEYSELVRFGYVVEKGDGEWGLTDKGLALLVKPQDSFANTLPPGYAGLTSDPGVV